MMYPLVLDLADDGIPVAVTCRVLGFSKQAFYQWKQKPACAVKDACSKRIVGYSVDARMTSGLAVTAWRNAVALRGPVATVVHSDRGSQFRSHAYQRALRDSRLRGSMGRVGTAPTTPRWSRSSACSRRT